MVNWNTSLFYVRVCLPAPLERPDVCTMNAKICEDGDHLSKSEQIAVLFGFPCDVRYFAFLAMFGFPWNVQLDALSWDGWTFKPAGTPGSSSSAWTSLARVRSCKTSPRKLRSSMPRHRDVASRHRNVASGNREVHGPPQWFTARNSFSFLLQR